MIKKILFSLIVAASTISPLLAQVGINTEDPQAILDVNGDLKIRTVPLDSTSLSILVLDVNNIVHRNTKVLGLSPKSFVEATGATAINLLNVNLLSGWYKIQFPTEEFDENNDYNVTTSEFTVPQTGIYNLYVQFATTSVISASEVGVGIFRKPSGGSSFSLIAEETFMSVNVSVLTINLDVSPPTRKTQRLVKLTKGDVIIFAAKVPAVSATLIGGSKSFFTVEQVK